MTCEQPDCAGHVVDGYCDVCGMAPRRTSAIASAAPARLEEANGTGAATPVPASSGPGSTRLARSGTVAVRRPGTRRTTVRGRLGAGLVEIPPTAYRDPSAAVLADPSVAEARRFCARCGEPVGRSRDGAPGRPDGFCRSCGTRFSFAPKLAAGDVVAGQYEVVGCLAHGGMGWVYLARDHNVSDRWVVLKGLLNTGDDDAMTAALAERRFLAEVEHPNIVRIHNFVQHGTSGYIVMEYVGGTSLKDVMRGRREANGGKPQPLPVAQAIAYILEILPAFIYLHDRGLLFCDFKLDNVIQTEDSLKLIDLGAVYRVGDADSPVYGTIGYQAPEIAQAGPTVASDLFTVGRTLALLCFDFPGYQGKFAFSLPAQDAVAVLERHDSLYRFLVKATAPDRDDRFQSADEMADQLFGVLREVVAAEDGRTVAASSTLFTGDLRANPARADWRRLPVLRVAADDPAAGYLATLSSPDPADVVEQLRQAPVQTVEVDASARSRSGRRRRVASCARHLRRPAQRRPLGMARRMGTRRRVPGRGTAGRRGAGLHRCLRRGAGRAGRQARPRRCARARRAPDRALRWYAIVAVTDPSYTTAAFGLARCRLATGDRAGALAAYDLVPAVVELARRRADRQDRSPRRPALRRVSRTPRTCVRPRRRWSRSASIPSGAPASPSSSCWRRWRSWSSSAAWPGSDDALLGVGLTERDLRTGIERSYRTSRT